MFDYVIQMNIGRGSIRKFCDMHRLIRFVINLFEFMKFGFVYYCRNPIEPGVWIKRPIQEVI